VSDALGRAITAVTVQVQRSRDRRRLDALMSEDRAYSAYALSHLEPGIFERTDFWVAESPTGTGIVMASDVIGATLITIGDTTSVRAALALHPGPRASYLSTAAPEHMRAIERWHTVGDPLSMRRMQVMRHAFTPIEGAKADAVVRRLRATDATIVNGLYALDDRSAHYSARQIEESVYYGAFEGGRLVAVAGTHVVSALMSVGVVGNVLTHPAYRGRGLATLVTSKVTSKLFEAGCGLAVLTADPANTPAVRAYLKLGYRSGAAIVEARLVRRDHLGIGAWLRRRRAEHSAGSELVRVALERPAQDY
jgi:RimJ/RimL family protein N-acetyltransferase